MAENLEGRLFYDSHAKNVYVKSKDNQDLETLIENGDIGSGSKFDPSEAITILYLSTMPGMENIADTIYTYTSIGIVQLMVGGAILDFYAYTRNASINEDIPIGTVVMALYNDVSEINKLGGTWELLGAAPLVLEGDIIVDYYMYKKTM